MPKKKHDAKERKIDEIGSELKRCSRCKIWKKLFNFGCDKSTSDGLRGSCKPCHAEKKEKPTIRTEIDGVAHKRCTICLDMKPMEVSFYRNKCILDGYAGMCKDCEKANRNREQQAEYNKEYKQVPVNKERRQENEKQRREDDPEYKLGQSLRVRQRHAILKGKKLARNKELFGESTTFIRSHIEDQFYDGMTWDNYGDMWELDHILPCAAFDINSLEEQKICFTWQNLQPLTCKDNNKKRDKIYRDLFEMQSWMLTPTIIERMTPNIIEENFYPLA